MPKEYPEETWSKTRQLTCFVLWYFSGGCLGVSWCFGVCFVVLCFV